MTPDELAKRYFSCIRTSDLDGLSALYEENATFVLPNGREITGRAAILEMQQNVFAHGALTPTPVSWITGSDGIAVEIETHLPDGIIRKMTDLFYLSEKGLILRLCVYAQAV